MSDRPTFDEILDELMLEEDAPTGEALERWQHRYPEFTDSLREYFATWAIQDSLPPGTEPDVDEEWITGQVMNYAIGIVREQGRLVEPVSIDSISEFDHVVLTAVYLLGTKATTATVTERVSKMSENETLMSTVRTALDRLEERHLVIGRLSNPETEPDRKARRYFIVTIAGDRVLAQVKATSKLLGGYLGDLA